jgi:anti-sigma factor RsiW
MTRPLTPECRSILGSISSYLEGDLDASACHTIERHAAGCRECQSVIDGLRQTVGLCRQAAAAPLPDPVRQRALARIRTLLEREGLGSLDPS